MIKQLVVKNFTVFRGENKIRFARNLNVIVGENKSGKTHLMKLAYALAQCGYDAKKWDRRGKDEWGRKIADKLKGVFKPESLGRLVTRRQGRNRCAVAIEFGKPDNADDIRFSFASNSKSDVEIDNGAPEQLLGARPVFLPSREILSVYHGFAAALENRELQFDDTFLDLAKVLALSPERGPRPGKVRKTMEELEKSMGGTVVQNNDRFYLHTGRERLEIQLEAEGIRRLAMLAYLIRNGTLREGESVLFWDEPETNLNPKLLRAVVRAIMTLSANGFQVVIATHSLFLLRELTLIRKNGKNEIDAAYFALVRDKAENGEEKVTIRRGKTEEEIEPIVALDEESKQASKYLRILP
jgi:hypothetical protein